MVRDEPAAVWAHEGEGSWADANARAESWAALCLAGDTPERGTAARRAADRADA